MAGLYETRSCRRDRARAAAPWVLTWAALLVVLFAPEASAVTIGWIKQEIKRQLVAYGLIDESGEPLFGDGSGDLTAVTVTGDAITVTDGTGPVPDLAAHANVEAIADAGTIVTADTFLGGTGAAIDARTAAEVRTSLGLGDLYPENSPLGETKGGTGQTTFTQGDLLISDAANSLGKLALGGTVGEILHQASATAPGYSDATIAALDSQGFNGKTYLATVAAAGDATIDFGDGAVQTLAISANATFDTTLSGLAAAHARSVQVYVTADSGGSYTTDFPADWKWIGTKPATLAASTTALLSLTARGPDEDDVVACWSVLGDGS